ncbi:hypothetical protein KIH23_12160 [Flavobacterium sp. CYK-55]|uniref:hypothetical protein n=1 Tax=Flavobacterium sp. CYK-55 TaxID=2835529 RepID=UPI001BCB01A8|nr:hypothetical protein [Flavobacterium sp. CYK-55]MBS7788052.1 hypothetical protein [Flavobacterium sp. CYK-55]
MLEKQLIQATYSQLQNQTLDTNKSQLYFTIIQIKKDNRFLENESQTLYKDVKCFILSYIHGSKQEDFGYDVIETKKINFAIKTVLSHSARYKLAVFCLSELKSCFYDDKVDEFKSDVNWYRLRMSIDRNGISKYWHGLLQFSGLNFWTISLTLIASISLCVLFLRDAIHPFFELYEFKFESFVKNDFANKFLNILAKPLGLAENFIIKPLNVYGLLILIFIKILYLIFIVNFLLERVKDYTKV